jgi:hypothetical protein
MAAGSLLARVLWKSLNVLAHLGHWGSRGTLMIIMIAAAAAAALSPERQDE